MKTTNIVWILALIFPVKGYYSTSCYYIYRPLLDSRLKYGNYDLTVNSEISRLNISLNNSPVEEIQLCIPNETCCRTSVSFPINVTSGYIEACMTVDSKLFVSPPQSSRYQARRRDQLGGNYYVVCRYNGFRCSFIIGLVQDVAHITVTFTNNSFTHNRTMEGNEISSASVYSVLNTSSPTVEFSCNCDLTGAYIESDIPVTAFSVIYHNSNYTTILPLAPIESWEKEYSLLSMNNAVIDEEVMIITSTKNTFVKVSGHATVNVPHAGSVILTRFDQGTTLHVKGSFPLLVLHFGDVINTDDDLIINMYPSMNNTYTCLDSTNGSVYLYYMFQNGTGSVEFNCTELQNQTNSLTREDTLVFIDGVKYTVSEVYGNNTKCQIQTLGQTYGYSLISDGDSFLLQTMGQSVHVVIEENYSIPSSLYNTDPNDNTTDSYGVEFIVLQPANATLRLFLSCADMTNITIYYDESTNQSILCNNTAPSYSVDVISSSSSKLIRIETNFLISVYVIGYFPHGMFGYLALPINVLGYEYMVVSYLNHTDINNSQWSYCYIASIYTNTEIHILPKSGFEAVYYEGNIVGTEQKIHLNEYETVTLASSTIDLTGMYIKSNKPFQLYCGGFSTTSVFYEQLIPINAWDYKYFLRDVSGMDELDCFYRVVSSETDNQIEIEDANGDISYYHVTRAEYLDLFPVEQEIRSNLTILVVLICRSHGGDISFSLVPSNKQLTVSPQKPTDDSFTSMTQIRKILFYRDESFIASHITAIKINTLACPLTKIGEGLLDTIGCFYGTAKNNNNTDCQCNCDKTPKQSNETLQEKVDQLVKELSIDKTTLSSYKNTKISAADPRPSSRGIGSVAAVILATLIVILLISDIPMEKTQLRESMAYCEILKLFKGILISIHIPTVTVDKVSLIHIPEKFYPGKFDFIGQGHQIFHIMVSLGTLEQFNAAMIDIKYQTPLLINHKPRADHIVLSLLAYTVMALITIYCFGPKIQNRVKEDVELEQMRKK
ncbi:unnamed protein product [Mytilus coruscus]|uniref:IgGFc-binding protein N-terminal domain-containing protein n=1 Tax=Mytilus coruscus TaxID=42192 RepID=A0A6J8DG18_MYTCO|nr:unnamed protein product [Mytilus coruscus]